MKNNHNLQNIFFHQLDAGLAQLNLNLSLQQRITLWNLLQLLIKWNRHFNLTSISEWENMVNYHLLDSLSIVPFLQGELIMDFGSGAGFPGLPLACYFPNKRFVLIESVGKKTRFIRQACHELALKNVHVVESRVELLSPTEYQFDCIVSRGVCTLKKLIELTGKFSHSETRWVAMKGARIEDELKDLTLPYKIVPLKVPGISADRVAVIINKLK